MCKILGNYPQDFEITRTVFARYACHLTSHLLHCWYISIGATRVRFGVSKWLYWEQRAIHISIGCNWLWFTTLYSKIPVWWFSLTKTRTKMVKNKKVTNSLTKT